MRRVLEDLLLLVLLIMGDGGSMLSNSIRKGL